MLSYYNDKTCLIKSKPLVIPCTEAPTKTCFSCRNFLFLISYTRILHPSPEKAKKSVYNYIKDYQII